MAPPALHNAGPPPQPVVKSQGRRVGGPGGILLCLGLAVVVWLIGGIRGRVVESGYQRIEAGQARLDSGRTWVDERWEGELAERLARLGPQEAADPEGRARIVNQIASLSFVAAAGDPEVLWPDGLRVPVLFQNPVACLPVGELFYPVAADGTLLSGSHRSPPKVGGGWLPVIGKVGNHYPNAQPGQVLDGEPELDALSIAISMWVHLAPEELGKLGRVVIDASRNRETGADVPGARIYLEQGRQVWFGRSPRVAAPGSLPEATKWENLTRALERLNSKTPGGNWERVDLRWDRPEISLFDDADQELLEDGEFGADRR